MTTPETMEERFEQKFGVLLPVKVVLSKAELKDFIRQEITLAVQEREDELREKIRQMESAIDEHMQSGATDKKELLYRKATLANILNYLLTKDS